MSRSGTVSAALLVIGNEILCGQTKDENISYIAAGLDQAGITLDEVRIVPDVVAKIARAINSLRREFDYVLTTGGLGPTHDDVTTDAVTIAFGVEVVDQDPRAVNAMRECFIEKPLTPDLMRMCRIPKGAELVPNPVSGAPGYMLENVVVMAGVPRIMQAMMRWVLPRLDKGERIISRSVRIDVVEGEVAELLSDVQVAHPQVHIGSYPFFEPSGFGTHVVFRSANATLIKDAARALCRSLDQLGTPYEQDHSGRAST